MVVLPQWFSCGVYYLTPERARPLRAADAILEQRGRAIPEGQSLPLALQQVLGKPSFTSLGEQLLDTAQAL